MLLRNTTENAESVDSPATTFANRAPEVPFRPSIPIGGRSLGNITEKIGKPLKEVVAILAAGKITDENSTLVFFDQVKNTSYNDDSEERFENRIAWFLLNVCILKSSKEKSDSFSSIEDSAKWFFEHSEISSNDLLRLIEKDRIDKANEILQTIRLSYEFFDLLPYLLEPHGHVTRGNLEKNKTARGIREKKRQSGVFYTPSDVARFMIKSAFREDCREGIWLDPACGTGVFLREILYLYYQGYFQTSHQFSGIEFCKKFLYGIDISSLSLDSCAFVLLTSCTDTDDIESHFFSKWKTIRTNLVSANSLLVSNEESLENPSLFDKSDHYRLKDLFPGINSGFDYVVMNPPYSKMPLSPTCKKLWYSFYATKAGGICNLETAFIEMLDSFLNENGSSAAVVSLSIGSSSVKQYEACRDFIRGSNGRWEFLFYDREPSSLFGEDVKTRNTIIFYKKDNSRKVYTSGLLKWRSRRRESIFLRDRLVETCKNSINGFIPKLGSTTEESIYRKILSHAANKPTISFRLKRYKLEEILDSCYEDNCYVGSTAYNYINTFLTIPSVYKGSLSLSSSPVNTICLDSPKDKFAIFAILVSRLAFWLWHIQGDGFHVTGSFIRNLPLLRMPFSKREIDSLAEHGENIWRELKSQYTVSNNAGKMTYSFFLDFNSVLRDPVEQILFNRAELDWVAHETIESFLRVNSFIEGAKHIRKIGAL